MHTVHSPHTPDREGNEDHMTCHVTTFIQHTHPERVLVVFTCFLCSYSKQKLSHILKSVIILYKLEPTKFFSAVFPHLQFVCREREVVTNQTLQHLLTSGRLKERQLSLVSFHDPWRGQGYRGGRGTDIVRGEVNSNGLERALHSFRLARGGL